MSQPATKPAQLVVRRSSRPLRPLYTISFLLIAIVFGWINNQNQQMVWLIVPMVLLAAVAVKDLLRRFEKLVIGGGKLRHETGILSRSTRTAELAKVQDVQVRQSFWQRLVGIGDLLIETAGEGPGIRMHGVDAPQQVADLILETAHK